MTKKIIFIKLGGSLITDKQKRETPCQSIIRAIAEEVKAFLDTHSDIHLLLGHGSGSYGHWEATKHKTQTGAATKQEWQGFTQVSAAAARLNRLVVDTFLTADVNVLSLQPSASIYTQNGMVKEYNIHPIKKCLKHNIVPLIYGDVAFDQVRGATIVSTEVLFSYLAPILKPDRIILLSNAAGVYNNHGKIIHKITPSNYPKIAQHVHGSYYTDVTGGMAAKVNHMLTLVRSQPNLIVHICSGIEPNNLTKILVDQFSPIGTMICRS